MTMFRREYAYYWICPRCNRECLTAEIVAGPSNICPHCQHAAKASAIVYDNGAESRFLVTTEGQSSVAND